MILCHWQWLTALALTCLARGLASHLANIPPSGAPCGGQACGQRTTMASASKVGSLGVARTGPHSQTGMGTHATHTCWGRARSHAHRAHGSPPAPTPPCTRFPDHACTPAFIDLHSTLPVLPVCRVPMALPHAHGRVPQRLCCARLCVQLCQALPHHTTHQVGVHGAAARGNGGGGLKRWRLHGLAVDAGGGRGRGRRRGHQQRHNRAASHGRRRSCCTTCMVAACMVATCMIATCMIASKVAPLIYWRSQRVCSWQHRRTGTAALRASPGMRLPRASCCLHLIHTHAHLTHLPARFNCQLARLQQQRSGGWHIVYMDHSSGLFQKIAADFVVIATGIYSLPFLPQYKVRGSHCV